MLIDAQAMSQELEPPKLKLPNGETRTGRILSHLEMAKHVGILEAWEKGEIGGQEQQDRIAAFVEAMGFKREEVFALPDAIFIEVIANFFASQKLPRKPDGAAPAVPAETPGTSS